MLELCKNVLKEVSFDRHLFIKELGKSIEWIKTNEVVQLKQWCIQEFGDKYGEVITDVFSNYV
ncbi:MAG: hypothetical protein ACPG6V_04175 [Flavobacteriales bacterium]